MHSATWQQPPMTKRSSFSTSTVRERALRQSARLAKPVANAPAADAAAPSSSKPRPGKQQSPSKRRRRDELKGSAAGRNAPSPAGSAGFITPSPHHLTSRPSSRDATDRSEGRADGGRPSGIESAARTSLGSRSTDAGNGTVAVNLVVPKGVVDIDTGPPCCLPDPAMLRELRREEPPAAAGSPGTSCLHEADVCSASSLTETYLSTYGREYYRKLRTVEEQEGYDEDGGPVMVRSYVGIPSSPSDRPGGASLSSTAMSISSSSSSLSGSTSALYLCPVTDYMLHQPHMSVKTRAILIDWLSDLSFAYEFGPEVFHLAVSLIDRCLGCVSADQKERPFILPRDMLQCLGCACFWIASKLVQDARITAEHLVHLCENAYTLPEITEMESTVCTVLHFYLHSVTPSHFVHRFLRASAASTSPDTQCPLGMENETLECMVLYLLELAALRYDLVPRKPSLLASSALYLARVTLSVRDADDVDHGGYWNKTLEHYTGYDIFDMEDTVAKIHESQRNPKKYKVEGVFKKYSSEEYSNVASVTVPDADGLGFY